MNSPLQDRRGQFEREALPHLDALRGFALRLARGDEARAQDLVQDALMNAWRAWHTYRPGSNCRAWLMAILRNAAINHYRSEGKRSADVEFEEVSDRTVFEEVRTTDPEGRFFDRLVDGEVMRAIESLPRLYREALVLSDLEGLSYNDVARVVDAPVGTVKSRLFRARRSLQRTLYDYAVEMGYVKPRGEPEAAAAGSAGRSAGRARGRSRPRRAALAPAPA